MINRTSLEILPALAASLNPWARSWPIMRVEPEKSAMATTSNKSVLFSESKSKYCATCAPGGKPKYAVTPTDSIDKMIAKTGKDIDFHLRDLHPK